MVPKEFLDLPLHKFKDCVKQHLLSRGYYTIDDFINDKVAWKQPDSHPVNHNPIAKPGFDALAMSAPVLVQMNPDGKWENSKPGSLDEERLKAIVQHLVKSKAVSAAQSYCGQCATESQREGGKSNYVPVIMMPIYPADQCPFDLDCEVQKIKETEEKKPTKKITTKEQEKDSSKDKTQKKIKKRQFVMQRLTDFDLLSQW